MGRNARGTMVLCFLISVLEGYDLQIISSAGPHLRRTMNLTPDQTGFFFSATLIGLGIGAVLGGWIADRIGRKPALIYSTIALGVFTLATTFAQNFEHVLITRIMAGIGLGGAMPAVIALISEVSGGRNTTSAVTTIICGQPTGGIISALVGKTLAEHYGWQSLFLTGGMITLVLIPLMFILLPETKPAEAVSGTDNSPKMSSTRALFGDGRSAGTILLWVLFILTLANLSVLLSWTPILVMGSGFSRSVGLNAIIAINLGGIAGGVAMSRLIDGFGVRWPMLGLYALMAVSLFLFSGASSFALLMVFAFFVGFAVLGAQFTLYGVSPQLYPIAGRGAGVGVAVAMGRLGSILGPIIMGRVLATGVTEREALVMMAPVALLAGATLFLLTVVSKIGSSNSDTAQAVH